jgi:hypothetical protein
MVPSVVPEVLDGWLRPFRCHFTMAAWRHVLVLAGGTLLAPGRGGPSPARCASWASARLPASPCTIAC